jgi:hypothetical protein
MTLLDYFSKAISNTYWATRVRFYREFNSNVLTALREQGHMGKYMSAGDMSRCLTQATHRAYHKLVTGKTISGEDLTTDWSVDSFADRWLNNVKGVAQFNKALCEAGYTGGRFTVVQDGVLARDLGYRRNEYIFKLLLDK